MLCTLVSSRALRTLIVAGAALSSAAAASAQPARYVDSTGVVRNYTSSGTRGGGLYSIVAEARNTNDAPVGDIHVIAGRYPAPPFTNTTRVVTRTGIKWSGTAQAQINTFTRSFLGIRLADGYNSGITSAALTLLGPTGVVNEFCSANAVVNDPNSYQVGMDESSAIFSLTFDAGFRLAAPAETDSTTRASVTGFQDVSLLSGYLPAGSTGGNLFNYAWSASSTNPDQSVFTFSSNPALGLDDAAITNSFRSAISGSGGVFSLMRDVVIEATIAAAPGTIYDFGGSTNYYAEAASVPGPGPAVLAAAGVVLMARRRRGGA